MSKWSTLPDVRVLDVACLSGNDGAGNTVLEVLAYGVIDRLPFVASGQIRSHGWSGVWSWTYGDHLGASLRAKAIRAIKASELTAAAVASPKPGRGFDDWIEFYQRHGDKKTIPFADKGGRDAAKAAGALFFKIAPNPFWIVLRMPSVNKEAVQHA